MVDLLPHSDSSETTECFLSSGRQNTPLSGCRELKLDGILGTASSLFLRVPLDSLAIHGSSNDTPTAAKPDNASITGDTDNLDSPDDPPPISLVSSIIVNANHSFDCGNTVPPYIRRIDFVLDATGWDPAAMDALSHRLRGRLLLIPNGLRRMFPATLRNYSSPGNTADPIAPLPTEPSLLKASRCHPRFLHCCRPHPTFHFPLVEPLGMRPKTIGRHPNHCQLPKTETRSPRSHRSLFPVSSKYSTHLAAALSSPYLTFSRDLPS